MTMTTYFTVLNHITLLQNKADLASKTVSSFSTVTQVCVDKCSSCDQSTNTTMAHKTN